jgi:hypothetical protein
MFYLIIVKFKFLSILGIYEETVSTNTSITFANW